MAKNAEFLKDLVWDINFAGVIGKTVRMTTHDGIIRTGRLTNVEFNGFKYKSPFQEVTVEAPMEFELNAEHSDRISVGAIATFEVLD